MLFLWACTASSPVEEPLSPEPIAAVDPIEHVIDQVIRPASDGDEVAYTVELAAGDVVEGVFGGEARVSSVAEVLVWIDWEPGALWGHSGALVFHDGDSFTTVESDQVPLVNDEPMDLSRTIWNERAEDFEQQPVRDGPARAWEAVEVPEGDCCEDRAPLHRIALILYNYDKGPLRKDITDNVTNMQTALGQSGFDTVTVYLGDKKKEGLGQLKQFVAGHVGPEHCCDEIFIYYTGHGHKKTIDGKERWYIGVGKGSSKEKLFAEDFAKLLGGTSSCHVNVAIDACYSGGFIDALVANGVESVRTSASSTEKAWGGAYDGVVVGGVRTPDPYGRPEGETGSEWTSGFAKGLREGASTTASGRTLNDLGYDTALKNDIAAIAGKTNPTGASRTASCSCCF